MRSMFAAAGVALASLVSVAAAKAQPVETFYRGRTVTLIISFAPGGSNDIAGRLLSRHFGRFVTGNPSIVVQNMGGAGGLVAANHLFNVAPRDGSVIGQLDRSVASTGLRGAKTAKFDALRFTWLGSLSSYRDEAYGIWISSRSPITSLEDLKRASTPPRIGAVTGGTNHLIAKVARDVLGLNIRIVAGYPGGSALWLALENGELDGAPFGFTSVKVERPQLWAAGALRGLVAFGQAERLPDLAQVPTARELAAGDPAKLALIDLVELPFVMAQPFVAPPELPAERAEALTKAFDAMTGDPAFIAEAGKLNVELSPIGADGIRKRLEAAARTPPETMAAYNRIVDGN